MSILNWPDHLDRTDADDRESTSKFSTSFGRTRSELDSELDSRMEAEQWRLDDVSGSGGDPGVVVRWTKDGRDHSAACDHYTSKAANLRAVYLWISETRLAGDRPVQTGRDQFAAAALPGDVEEDAEPVKQPHEVLDVAPDAPEAVVRGAYRELEKKHHGDTGDGDMERLQQIREAKEELIG